MSLPNKKKICLSTVYRVGTLGKDNFLNLQKHFNSISASNRFKYSYIIGDFNLDSINWNRNCASHSTHSLFLNLFNNLGLSQLIHSPTHKHGSVLDILLTDSPDMLEDVYVHDPGSFIYSDHSPVTFSIKAFLKIPKSIKRTIHNYKKANWHSLNQDLSRIDWEHLFGQSDIHDAWSIFKNKLTSLCNKHIPKIKVKDSYQPPWFDSEVFRLNKKKEKFRKLFKQTKSQCHYSRYTALRKSLKMLIKSKMNANFDSDLSPNTITKKFWSFVKSSSKSCRIPEKMHLGECIRRKSKDIADLFNKYFYEQFSEESLYDIDINFNNDNFFDFTIHTNCIYQQLSRLNSNKSMGPDNISGRVLKECAISTAYPLHLLFNLSFKTGSLPADWKLAHIVPIHKKGDKDDIENYRPISLISIISKVFEKCIRDELLLECQKFLHDSQHGFLPLKSCTTQLVPFSHDISIGLNSNNLIDVIYFDFAKAFDTVNHDIILLKLKNEYKIDGLMLKFVKEYLQGRIQRVAVNGTLSDTRTVKSGVPQGSILGPLLFVLFINDMQSRVSPGTKIALYADDTKIWRHILTPDDHKILQKDIDALHLWSIENKMQFHAQKCKVLSINHFHNNLFSELPFFLFPYEINNAIMDYFDEEKDLGITITSKFKFSNHRQEILSKALNQFNLLRRTCHFVKNSQKRRTLYLSLVRSLFEHGSQIWSPNISSVNNFENFQKSCVKWILKEQYIPYSEAEYLEKLISLNILPLQYKFTLSDLLLLHKCVYELIPLKIPEEIVPLDTRTRSNANTTKKYQLSSEIQIRKNVLASSFFVRAIHQWNQLPDGCRENPIPSQFKSNVMNYMWSLVKNRLRNLNHNNTPIEIEPD